VAESQGQGAINTTLNFGLSKKCRKIFHLVEKVTNAKMQNLELQNAHFKKF